MTEPPAALASALADRFRIEREIERGLMTTYLAHDLDSERPVLLKVPRTDITLAVDTARFLAELEPAVALKHPHIVPIVDAGSAGAFLYYVSPNLEGETLRVRLARDGRLAVEVALRTARDVARGLNHGHEQGLRHGFLRPDTVLVTERGAAATDFGVLPALLEAKRAGPDLPQTLPFYAAPELADPYGEPDAGSDLYSLGCVLFEMLAGEPPFRGNTPTILMSQHKGAPIPDIIKRRPEVPPAVRAILARALAKESKHLFQSGAAFALSLEEEMSSRPDVPLPPELLEASRRRRARGCRSTAVLACVAIVLAVAATALLLFG